MKIFDLGNTKLWRILTSTSAFLLATGISALVVSTQNFATINGALGIPGTKIVETGDGENTDTIYYKSDYSSMEQMMEHNQEIAKKLEAEGVVLLKNDNNVLPLSSGSKISCFSRSSVDIVYGGTGSGSVSDKNKKTLKESFEQNGRMSVNPTLWQAYLDYTDSLPSDANTRVKSSFTGAATFRLLEAPTSVYTSEVKSSYTAYKDAAIVVISRAGGEGADLPTGSFEGGEKYLALQEDEKAMLEEVKANFDKIVVLVNSSNAMELGWLDEYDVDACLWIGGVGQMGLDAVADILVGNENPSGGLVDVYPEDSFSAPAMQNFGDFTYSNLSDLDAALMEAYGGAAQQGRYSKYLVYQEGIYVGYKYYETRYEDAILGRGNASNSSGAYASKTGWSYSDEVTFPFGYGMSYTTFKKTLKSVTATEDGFELSVEVENTGDYDGKSVVEIYAQAPYTQFDIDNKLEKSSIQLVGFGKTDVLKKGDKTTVSVTVDKYDIATYDNKVNKGYILEAGDYYLSLGDDSHDALNNILAHKGKGGMTDQDGKSVEGDKSDVYKWTLDTTDTTSFMYTDDTKQKVTNKFDDADLNHYGDNLVTYLTRNDWTTYPTPYENLSANQKIIDGLKFTYQASSNTDTSSFKTEQKNGLTLVMFRGADFDDPLWEDLLDQLSLDDLMTLVARAMKNEVTSVAKPFNYLKDGPQSITGSASSGGGLYYTKQSGETTLDGEDRTETPTTAYTSETVACATWNKELMYEFGKALGEDGLWSLVQHHYAPGANIHRTPYAGRNFEYYSEDGYLSAVMAQNEVKGQREKGLITYIKHFTLNDQETNRTGVSTFCTEQVLRETYLRAFEYAFTKGGTNAVMGSFNRIGTTWSGAHKGLMTDCIRNEWGFNGVVDTDFALWGHMEARSGVMAGTTDFAVTNNTRSDELMKSIESDYDLYTAVREAAKRNLYVVANSAEMNGLTATMKIVTILTFYQIIFIVMIAVCAVWFLVSLLMLVGKTYIKKEA